MNALKTYEPPSRLPATANSTQFAWRPINVNNQGDRDYLETTTRISRYSARDAWKHYDTIGEVHYGVDRTGVVAGYGRLFAQRINARGQATDDRDAGVLADIVAGIYGKFGGVRGLLERADTLMRVPAEGYLIRVVEGGVQDGYWILSPDEIQGANLVEGAPEAGKPIKWITATSTGTNGETNQFVRDIAPEDFLGRIWMPSKRFVDMVNSPMAALAPLCEELTLLTQGIMGRLRQRFAIAGILLIPSEINDANIAGAKPGEEHSDKVLSYLITLMTRNVQNHDQASAFIPALLKGPAAALEAFRHVILDTMIADTDIKLRAELIDRIMVGLDVQKQQASDNEGSNHWNAWANAEDERRIAVQPKLEALCHALTRAILHPELVKRGWEPARILPWRVWFDLSDASTRVNQSEDFRLAWANGWIGDEAGRRAVGAKETDKMTPEEKVRWTGFVTKDPYLMVYGIDGKDGIAIDWDKVGASKKPPGPDAGPDGGKVGPGSGDPGSPSDRDSDTPRSKEPG